LRQIWCVNPLERANKKITHRTAVVGVFPNPAASLRLSGSVLIEQHDEGEATERRYFSEASSLELTTMNNPIEVPHEAVILPELTEA
jgi:transposase-like protein